jgi:hypothetical protein
MRLFFVFFLLLSFFLTGLGCSELQRKESVSDPLPVSLPEEIDPSEFVGRSISHFMMVIFPDELNKDEWSRVFRRSEQIASAQKRDLELSRQLKKEKDDSQQLRIEEEIFQNQEKTLLLLVDFFESDTAYFLNWDDQDQCSFSVTQPLGIECEPLDFWGSGNFFSGGYPQMTGPLEVKMLKQGERSTFQVVEFILRSRDVESHGDFTVTLQLQKERDELGVIYRGDVIVHEGSVFLSGDEGVRSHFPFGYAELRFFDSSF